MKDFPGFSNYRAATGRQAGSKGTKWGPIVSIACLLPGEYTRILTNAAT